jgi:hypothetical protein
LHDRTASFADARCSLSISGFANAQGLPGG